MKPENKILGKLLFAVIFLLGIFLLTLRSDASDMTPVSTVNDDAHCSNADAKLICQGPHCSTRSIESANLPHLLFRKAMHSVSLASILPVDSRPSAFSEAVARVIGVSSEKKMRWVYASRRIAVMADL